MAGMSADNVRGWEIVWKLNIYEIRAIAQPRTLSANIPASEKGVYLFYNPPINLRMAIEPHDSLFCWLFLYFLEKHLRQAF